MMVIRRGIELEGLYFVSLGIKRQMYRSPRLLQLSLSWIFDVADTYLLLMHTTRTDEKFLVSSTPKYRSHI